MMQWFIVTGRVAFDEEDSVQMWFCQTARDAERAFRRKVRQQRYGAGREGREIYVNYVIACGSREPEIKKGAAIMKKKPRVVLPGAVIETWKQAPYEVLFRRMDRDAAKDVEYGVFVKRGYSFVDVYFGDFEEAERCFMAARETVIIEIAREAMGLPSTYAHPRDA